jgi:IclR family acetate operon transcriptional repressor
VGKAILSQQREAEVRELLQRTGMPKHTETTITDLEEFMAQLHKAQEEGYATDDSGSTSSSSARSTGPWTGPRLPL